MRKGNRLLAGALMLAATGAADGAERATNTQPNTVSCTLVRTAAQLQAMRNNLAANYCLANDIDLASISNFIPIGDPNTPFTGSLFGNNHVIRNLTIKDSTHFFVGLFGVFEGATIRDVSLVNVHVAGTQSNATIGALAGEAAAPVNGLTIENVSVSGTITCADVAGGCGGLIGELLGYTLSSSSSSATVSGAFSAGGVTAFSTGPIVDSFATGDVSCRRNGCFAAGLATTNEETIARSFATGSVTGGDNSLVGGLVAVMEASVRQSFASGVVIGGASSIAGGLIGEAFIGNIDQSFSVGPVGAGAGATVGGLLGAKDNGVTVTNSYWDTETSGIATSTGGTGLTTMQLRAMLPAGFDPAVWAITKNLSYPFVNDDGADFTAQLATVVSFRRTVTLLPISQLDLVQYRFKPLHADEAALATTYTMIARATGFASGVQQLQDQLRNVKIDRYFWHDAKQAATFTGPATTLASLGALRPLGSSIAPVINQLDAQRLVILRGSYINAKGAAATHWMLATLYTKGRNGSANSIIANDPWTGWQVEIDPVSKKVTSPANFPLKDFKVNAFQAVTIHLPL